MKVYRTKYPLERLNVRYVSRKGAIRIAARGKSVYIPILSICKAAELSVVILVTLAAFYVGVIFAYLERGYVAHGGEYLLLLIPPIYYAAKRTIGDWVADLRGIYREGDNE